MAQYRKMFNIGLDRKDVELIYLESFLRSILSYSFDSKIKFTAYLITRLRSDLYRVFRHQLKNSNLTMNKASIQDWQLNEHFQPKDNSQDVADNKEYMMDWFKKEVDNNNLSKEEKKVYIEYLERISDGNGEHAKGFNSKKEERTWQRARRKISKNNNND